MNLKKTEKQATYSSMTRHLLKKFSKKQGENKKVSISAFFITDIETLNESYFDSFIIY